MCADIISVNKYLKYYELSYKNSMTKYYKFIQQVMRIDKRRYEKSVENNLKF